MIGRENLASVSPLWRPFFYTAALYNLLIGGAGLANTAAPVNDRIVGLLVLCFGIVYALVGRDAARFGPVLWVTTNLDDVCRVSYINDNVSR
jgi:hypothetical protein